jgi:hypothetical protein
MSETRTILTGVGTYVGERGGEPVFGQWGWRGDEVEVHEDYVDEFDAHNVETGDGKEVTYERVGVNLFGPVDAAKANAGKPDEEEAEETPSTPKKAPAKKAT